MYIITFCAYSNPVRKEEKIVNRLEATYSDKKSENICLFLFYPLFFLCLDQI